MLRSAARPPAAVMIVVGDQLAIPASAPMPSGLSPLGQKLFRALQTYGGFDIDTTEVALTSGRRIPCSSHP